MKNLYKLYIISYLLTKYSKDTYNVDTNNSILDKDKDINYIKTHMTHIHRKNNNTYSDFYRSHTEEKERLMKEFKKIYKLEYYDLGDNKVYLYRNVAT